MGNNSEHRGMPVPGASSQRISSNPGHRTRLSGLMPTDGHEAYKRAAPTRASRRSRAERTSYLVATGHLDPEETEQLNGQSDSSIHAEIQQQHFEQQSPSISSPTQTRFNRGAIPHKQTTSDQTKAGKSPVSPRVIPNRRSNFEPSFLDDLNRTLANSPTVAVSSHSQNLYEFKQDNAYGASAKSKKDSRKKNKKRPSLYNSRANNHHDTHGDDDDSHGRFRQSYTEVTLPMKTSPAFEYILKDHERRNKRCCLWFVYSTLITICLAVIIFCSVHLILRSQ